MRLEPFSKANSIAMLNTLYPPSTNTAPTRQVTLHILTSQRSAFFRYIQAVEKNGKAILKNLEHQGQRPGDANGWTVVRDVVDKYLRAANGVIEECLEVSGPEDFDAEIQAHRRSDRRADSGVSFATGDRPSTSSSTGSKSNASSKDKPLPASPAHPGPPVPPMPKKRGTTLEKIAREIRNLRSRNDVKEISTNYSSEVKDPKARSLKKMKSTSSIGGAKAKHARFGNDETMTDFNIDNAKRQRMIWEAQREKENRVPDPAKMGVKAQGRSIDLEA